MTDMKFLRFECVEISQEQDMTDAFSREGPVYASHVIQLMLIYMVDFFGLGV